MKTKRRRMVRLQTASQFVCVFLVLTCLFSSTRHLTAQGTAFSYQGRLQDVTNLANGTYDLTFTEMIIWGGYFYNTSFHFFNNGGRYNPVSDSWSPMSTNGAPTPRYLQTAIWTGTEMIVWGGLAIYPNYFNNGGRYNPATDSWSAASTLGAPSARSSHTAVWTGTEMIIWGGRTSLDEWGIWWGGRRDLNPRHPDPQSGALTRLSYDHQQCARS